MFAGCTGVLMDPIIGARAGGGTGGAAAGAIIGVAKGILGIAVRPAAAVVESTSRVLRGLGLVCLGTQGIQGKLVRRVRAPETIMADTQESTPLAHKQAALKQQLLEAWQGAIGYIIPKMTQDRVVDVIAARSDRVVILTDHHLAYLKASHAARSGATTYKLKWYLKNEQVMHVHGSDISWRVHIESHKPVKFGKMVLKMPVKKSIRCSSGEVFQQLIVHISSHVTGTSASNKPDDNLPPDYHRELPELSIARTPRAAAWSTGFGSSTSSASSLSADHGYST